MEALCQFAHVADGGLCLGARRIQLGEDRWIGIRAESLAEQLQRDPE